MEDLDPEREPPPWDLEKFYERGPKLGEGGNGEVYLYRRLPEWEDAGPEEIVVKILKVGAWCTGYPRSAAHNSNYSECEAP